MKVLYFDCFSGISGDMALGALLDLGVDSVEFKSELDKLNLSGYEIVIEKKKINGIIGTDVQVILDGNERENDHHFHSHDHSMRRLPDIEDIIETSDLKMNVKDLSIKVFREIAQAEARVHNMPVNEVHFHETGALDSIIDIVGTVICIDLLGVNKVFSSVIHDGQGFIECKHGIIPVPVPAVMEMLRGTNIPFITEDIKTELVTPTGMGLIKCLASDFGGMPAMIIDRIGYGMGKRETGRLNALRVVVGTLPGGALMMEEISMLETNIDDMSPEILAFVSEKLLESGALDVYHTPVYMKKGRPAVMLTVISGKDKEQELAELILKETSTLGVRKNTTERYSLNRKTVEVDTGYGRARVKVASGIDYSKAAPEYDDCSRIARKTGIALKDVYDMVLEEYRKRRETHTI